MTDAPRITVENGVLVRHGFDRADVGDLDQKRNLKIRTFVGPGLRPVFEDLQSLLRFREMGIEGVAPGHYYEDFEAFPAAYGYDEELQTELRVSLQTAMVESRSGPAKRLIIETRGEIRSQAATGWPPAVGFEPPLGDLALAGRSRVIHMLTRPKAPPGERAVTDVPRQLEFLTPQEFEGDFPTIDILSRVPEGYSPAVSPEPAAVQHVWGMANSDVFQHVHAREYLYAMENRMGELAADADVPLANTAATRAQVIFRRPSLVGERYELRSFLYRQDDRLLALGSFHSVVGGKADDRPASYLRFEAQLT